MRCQLLLTVLQQVGMTTDLFDANMVEKEHIADAFYVNGPLEVRYLRRLSVVRQLT